MRVKKTFAVGLIAGLVLALVAMAVMRPEPASAGPRAAASSGGEPLSLITSTPEEGFALALTLSRRGVTATQPDREVLHALRPEYSQDAASLIAASHVVAVHFQTIAAANEYWRD